MSFKCGIVGLPNVGKSTLFNCLTETQAAEAANYPFCTIEPNIGMVEVPDQRLEALAKIVKPQRVLPTTVEFVDIAGLVKGAALGEGLGNKFLAHIREVDAIVQVVRCFENDNIIHVANQLVPADDIDIINTELCLADLETVERALLRLQKAAKSGDKNALAEITLLTRVKGLLNQVKALRGEIFSNEEQKILKSLQLLTIKPVLFVANVAENGFANNPLLDMVASIAKAENAEIISICASLESELIQLDAAEKELFLQELKLAETGLSRLIQAAYRLLKLETYFTAGEKEVRAWTIPKGTLAPAAAGVIHSDFEKGFIRASVIAYEDYIACKGESGAKEAGKLRLEGKTYEVQDGDVMHFLFNV